MITDSRIDLPPDIGPKIGRFTVTAPVASLYSKPSKIQPLASQIIFGQQLDIYKLHRGWAWGQRFTHTRRKGYIGYIKAAVLSDEIIRPTHHVSAMGGPVFTKPDIKSPVQMVLPLNSRISSGGSSDDFIKIGPKRFLHAKHLSPMSKRLRIEKFVSVAEAHMGLPYIWGGVSSFGLDCSGLVQSSLYAAGHDAPRDSDMQMAALGQALPIRQSGLKRGDLIFWKGHVGIMLGAAQMIHANAYHMKVASEPLSEAVLRIKAAGGGDITAIKRL